MKASKCNSERDFWQKFIEDATFTLSFNFLLLESRRLPAFDTFFNFIPPIIFAFDTFFNFIPPDHFCPMHPNRANILAIFYTLSLSDSPSLWKCLNQRKQIINGAQIVNVASVSSAHSLSSHIRGKFRPATNLFPVFSRHHLADVFLFINFLFK